MVKILNTENTALIGNKFSKNILAKYVTCYMLIVLISSSFTYKDVGGSLVVLKYEKRNGIPKRKYLTECRGFGVKGMKY